MLCKLNMNILFYGYGNHAKRIKKYLDEYLTIPKNYCFIKKSIENINKVDSFNDISEAIKKFKQFSCVFIASPNKYHLEHFKDCINFKIPYIYIEKPAIGIEEFLQKNSLNKSIKFLQIGYHYNYTPAIKKLKNIIEANSFGSLIRLDIFFGKGIAFKDNFLEGWRAQKHSQISETLGSHLLNIAIYLLGRENIKYNKSIIKKSVENSFYDTYHFSGFTKDSIMFSLTASWGSPLNQSIKAYFSNLIWSYDMKNISKKYPRDCFDESGLFKAPPETFEDCEHPGIKTSISSFIDKVLSGKDYIFELNNSGFTYELLSRN